MDEGLIEEFLDKKNLIAIIGVSKNPQKRGHRVYRDLKNRGYKAYPVNPDADEILGDKCYGSLEALPKKPDVVDIVVPPKVTEEIVKDCKRLGIKRVWLQPGSESEAAIKFCQNNNIAIIFGKCIMAERHKREKQ